VLVVADGIILGFDMAMVRPRLLRVTPDTDAVFASDDTLLASHNVQRYWEWIEIASGKRTKLDLETFGMEQIVDLDGTNRVLVKEHRGKDSAIYLMEKGEAKTRKIVEGEGSWARLVEGNALIYSTGDAHVMAIVDDGPPREVAKLAGMTDGAVPLSHLRAAVHSTGGELVRIDLGTGKLDRTNVAIGTSFLIQGEPSGRVILAEDRRVLLWDGAVQQIAEFDQGIDGIMMMQGALAVTLKNHETFLLDLKPNAKPVRVLPPGRFEPSASIDGKLMISMGNAEQINVLELPGRVRWNVPPYYRSFGGGPTISPHNRRVMQHINDLLVIYTLPQAPSADFAQWLDEQTNATVDIDGELIWPWQQPNPKP
jgi:hypothetical protein